jgi:hypothetical protein
MVYAERGVVSAKSVSLEAIPQPGTVALSPERSAGKMPRRPTEGLRMFMEGIEPFAAFERNLNEWLTVAVEPLAEPPPRPTEPILMRLFEERLKRLQSHLDKAERDAEFALGPLTDDIQTLRQWLDALGAARAKLVERTVRRVG